MQASVREATRIARRDIANEQLRANGLAFGRMFGRLPTVGHLRANLQSKADHWSRGAGIVGIAWPSTPGRLHRRVPWVHDELGKGRDVPPAGRILKADDQLLPERTPYLHERLHGRLVLAALEPANGGLARADAPGESFLGQALLGAVGDEDPRKGLQGSEFGFERRVLWVPPPQLTRRGEIAANWTDRGRCGLLVHALPFSGRLSLLITP